MERWLTGTTVVLIWGAINTLLAATLAGFTAAGLDGGPGTGGALTFILYAASATLVFLIGLTNWAVRRRHAGQRVPPRPVAALLLAVAVAIAWLGLPLDGWPVYIAVAALIAAIVAEVYPREHPE